jgi:hypothetical protein
VSRMDERVRRLAEQLLDTGFDKLSERECRVITGVAERSQVSRDVNSAFDEKQTFGDRLADRVAMFGGSWTFIILFLATLVAWVVLNSVVLVLYELWSMLVCGFQAATCSSAACTGSPSRKRTPWITWASRCEPSNRRQLRSAALASL